MARRCLFTGRLGEASRGSGNAGLWTPGLKRLGHGCPLQRQWVTAMVAAPRTQSYLWVHLARLLEPTLFETTRGNLFKCFGVFVYIEDVFGNGYKYCITDTTE